MPIRFQVDADFYDHPKSIGMSDAATALWVRAGSYSAAKLLDGFIAEHVLSTLSRTPEEAAAELVARGLWRRVRGGFQFHQYAERNLTKADVEAERKYERERKRERRAAAKAQANGHSVPAGRPPGVPDMSRLDSGRSPSGSVSVSVSVSESELGRGANAPDPPSRYCPDHPNGTRDPCSACARAREQAKAAREPKPRVRPHAYVDDGTEVCAGCRLPRANRAHAA